MKMHGPIVLMKIGKNSLLDKHIQNIVDNFDNYEIILCLGFGAESIISHVNEKYEGINIRIVENKQHEETTNSESIRLCLNNLNSNCVVFLDASIYIPRCKDFYQSINTGCNNVVLLNSNNSEGFDVGVNVNNNTGKVEHFCYGASCLWSEVFVVNGKRSVFGLKSMFNEKGISKKLSFEILNCGIDRLRFNSCFYQQNIYKVNKNLCKKQEKEKV
jgi:hypothetical protein